MLPDVAATGAPPIRQVIFHYADGEQAVVAIRPSAGVDALYAPRRYLFDQLLVDAAAAAGAEVLHETQRDGAAYATPPSVSWVCRSAGGEANQRILPATLTVGADGIRSTVARQVDAPVSRRGVSAGGVLYRYFHDLPAEGYEWSYGDQAATGFIPTNDGTCVFVGTTPARIRSLRRNGAEHAFNSLVASAGPALVDRVAAATPAGRMHGWSGAVAYLRRCWGPGWALVGDAGYFKDPITTHGMTDALRDAELLADAILAMLSGSDETSVLAEYEHTRDRLSNDMFNVTEAVAAYDWELDRVRHLLREVSSAMGDEVDHLQALPQRPGVPAA